MPLPVHTVTRLSQPTARIPPLTPRLRPSHLLLRASRVDADCFRRRRFYTAETHSVLRAHQPSLEQFFRVYADEDPKDLVINDMAAGSYAARPPMFSSSEFGTDLSFLAFPQANLRMNLDGWLGLLEDSDLLHSDEGSGHAGQIGMEEATWCFIWSQDFVADEVARADALQQISFVGFMEALCRVTMFIKLPDKQSMAVYQVRLLLGASV